MNSPLWEFTSHVLYYYKWPSVSISFSTFYVRFYQFSKMHKAFIFKHMGENGNHRVAVYVNMLRKERALRYKPDAMIFTINPPCIR